MYTLRSDKLSTSLSIEELVMVVDVIMVRLFEVVILLIRIQTDTVNIINLTMKWHLQAKNCQIYRK